MKQDVQLKLQAYLDGELPPGEVKALTQLLASDGEAQGLVTELTHTRSAVAAYEAEVKVPATREFYWSGIRREIERLEAVPVAKPQDTSIFTMLRRMLVPASGVAAVLVAVMLAGHQFYSSNGSIREAETTFEDSGAFTYRDYTSGTTLVWMDYPAENDFAEMDSDDTLEFD